MANILDYLDWRGDLTLAQSAFNEVDNLILAELSYADLAGIVPAVGEGPGIPLAQAAEAFFRRERESPTERDMGFVAQEIPPLLKKLAVSRRFGQMELSCLEDYLDAEGTEQFAALAIDLGNGTAYLSFRGTDGTIAGWKEDFLLATQSVIPAQRRAVAYTQAAAKQLHRRKLMLGGHSKGGNLAVYAGVFAPPSVQRRITAIWSNDGPGFRDDILDLPEHVHMEGRIRSIVPKSSVVGMLLEHPENYTVVDSDQRGLLQHDGFSWLVMGDHFLHLREMTRQSRLNDQELRKWLQELSPEQREKFVDGLFDVLTASGAETLSDLRTDKWKTASAMVWAAVTMDPETRDGLLDLLALLFRGSAKVLLEELQEESEKLRKQ